MPKVQILNPNDQPIGKWRLINELRACLISNDYHTLLMAVAFAKTGPLLRLKTEIEQWLEKDKKISSIFGINHRNTSRQALQFALDNFTKAHVLFHSDDFTYHPKMYLFVGSQKCKFFIGSHNLTVGGTETNWESGIEVSLILPEDKEILAEAMTAWNSLLLLSTELSESLIDQYNTLGKVSDETEPRRRLTTTKSAGPSTPLGELLRPILKIKPPSPLPKALFIGKSPNKQAIAPKGTAQKLTLSQVSAETLVIQIVPHHNGEFLMSKRAVDQNPNFFRWPFTGETIPKKSKNSAYPQRVPDPIVDLKIYGNGTTPIIHMPRLALNTVYYKPKSEIRMTVPPEVVRNTPALSILVMRQTPDDSEFDYEMEVFPPTNPQFQDYFAVCNQTMPSGGRENPRRMGWL